MKTHNFVVYPQAQSDLTILQRTPVNDFNAWPGDY